MLQRVSPAVLEMPSVGSRKTKEQEEEARRRKAEGKRLCFVLNKIGACRPSVSMSLPSLILR